MLIRSKLLLWLVAVCSQQQQDAPPFYVDSLPWQQPAARRTVFLLSAFPFSRWAAYAGQRLSKNTRPRSRWEVKVHAHRRKILLKWSVWPQGRLSRFLNCLQPLTVNVFLICHSVPVAGMLRVCHGKTVPFQLVLKADTDSWSWIHVVKSVPKKHYLGEPYRCSLKLSLFKLIN